MASSPRLSVQRFLPRIKGALIILLVASVSFALGTRSEAIFSRLTGRQGPDNLDLASVQTLYDKLRGTYDGIIDPSKLVDGAKHGLAAAAGDPYTVYFTAAEAKEFNSELEGSFEGIGAELGKKDNHLTIVSTLDDSPARRAGLLGGDIIVRVNGQDASVWSVEKAVKEIRGPKGTTVKITVLRGDDQGAKEVSITRDTIVDPSVKSKVEDGIGYMRISRFGDDAGSLARQGAQQFKDAGVKGVVLDLRGNGGGFLTAAREVAGVWLNDKVVTTQRTGGRVTDTLRTGSEALLEGVPTVTLVDGGSASASEIVAGALADNHAARLLGEKTFGKGSVQTVEQLPDGGELKVTIAKWYTPGGKNIAKAGITPDIVVALDDAKLAAGTDTQKDAAFALLK